jgi:hypothetical protein
MINPTVCNKTSLCFRLNRFKPSTIHAASQIQGMTPHGILFLQSYLTKRYKPARRASVEVATEAAEGGGEHAREQL